MTGEKTMVEAQTVIEKACDYIPDGVKEMWNELPRDIDTYVAHDFIRDVIKPWLIRAYSTFTEQLKEKGVQPHEIADINARQGRLLEVIGLIEVYFSEFD